MQKAVIFSKQKLEEMFLGENRESKNINLARKYLVSKGLDNERAQDILDRIRHDISNARLADSKFLLGLARMTLNGQLENSKIIFGINKTLKFVANPAHVNEYDNNLNGMTADELIEQFSTAIQQDNAEDMEKLSKNQYVENKSYQIVRIPDFKTASRYSEYTEWCVTQDKGSYSTYTDDMEGVFYFCLRNGWKDEERKPGENTPFDDYGLSMVAVSVYSDGSLKTCTTRWNHGDKELGVKANDQSMNTSQISQLVGRNFYQTFLPRTKEEIASIKKKQDEPYIKALNVIKSSPDAYYDFYISLPLVGNYQAVIIGREDNYRVLYNDGPNSFYLTDNEGYIKSFSNVNSFAQKYIVWRKDTNMEVFEVASSQVVFSMKNVSYFSAIRNVLEVEKTDDTVIFLSSDLKVIEPIENLKKIRWEGREYFTLIDGSNNRFLFDGKNLKLVTNESFVVVTGLGQKLLCCFNRDGEQFKVFNVHKGLLSDWFYNNPKQRSKLYYNEDYYYDVAGGIGYGLVTVNGQKMVQRFTGGRNNTFTASGEPVALNGQTFIEYVDSVASQSSNTSRGYVASSMSTTFGDEANPNGLLYTFSAYAGLSTDTTVTYQSFDDRALQDLVDYIGSGTTDEFRFWLMTTYKEYVDESSYTDVKNIDTIEVWDINAVSLSGYVMAFGDFGSTSVSWIEEGLAQVGATQALALK